MDSYAWWIFGFIMGNVWCYLSLARPALKKWTEAKQEYWNLLKKR